MTQPVRHVALLRGINLGKRRVKMAALVKLFEELGFADVASFIASGNLVFTAPATPRAKLEGRIATHLEQALGYPVDTFVRTAAEVVAAAERRLFPEDGSDAAVIHVVFCHAPLPAAQAAALEAIRTPLDAFRVFGSEFYWLCRSARSSDSAVWERPETRALKLPSSTARNVRSLRRLVAEHLRGHEA
jgi:uncharacterized protein (DUF1697 family)